MRRAERRESTPAHVDRQRRQALLMIWTGLARVAFWTLLLLAFLVGLVWRPFNVFTELFALVAFTAAISDISLIETAWGQVAASLAQLTAGDAHASAKAAQSTDVRCPHCGLTPEP